MQGGNRGPCSGGEAGRASSAFCVCSIQAISKLDRPTHTADGAASLSPPIRVLSSQIPPE